MNTLTVPCRPRDSTVTVVRSAQQASPSDRQPIVQTSVNFRYFSGSCRAILVVAFGVVFFVLPPKFCKGDKDL